MSVSSRRDSAVAVDVLGFLVFFGFHMLTLAAHPPLGPSSC